MPLRGARWVSKTRPTLQRQQDGLPMKKLVLGLIGGIGSGKSRVAEEFARHGARVITADAFGHEALRQPDVIAHVAERLVPQVLDERCQVNQRAEDPYAVTDARGLH